MTLPESDLEAGAEKPVDSPARQPEVTAFFHHAQAIGAIGRAPLDLHVQQAASFFDVLDGALPDSASVLDLGSGAGLPGLVLADTRPLLTLTLLDARAGRIRMLEGLLQTIQWTDRVQAVCLRAEVAGRQPELRGAFDLVVSRGFGPPAVTAECAAPFLRKGGYFVVSDPPGTLRADRWDVEGCARLGLRLVRHVVEPWSLSVFRQVDNCPDLYPRAVGVPAKRPLF